MISSKKNSLRKTATIAAVIFIYSLIRSFYSPVIDLKIRSFPVKNDVFFGVEHYEHKRVASPDAKFDAVITYDEWNWGLNSTESEASIILVFRENPYQRKLIYNSRLNIKNEKNFINYKMYPEVRWINNNEIEVTVENDDVIFKREKFCYNLNIIIVFNDDIPHERLEKIRQRYPKEFINDRLLDMYDIPKQLRQNMPLTEGKPE